MNGESEYQSYKHLIIKKNICILQKTNIQDIHHQIILKK